MNCFRVGMLGLFIILSSACSSRPEIALRASFRTQDQWENIQAFYRDTLQQQGWEQSNGTLIVMAGEKQAFQYVMLGCPSRYLAIERNAQQTDTIEIVVFEKPCV